MWQAIPRSLSTKRIRRTFARRILVITAALICQSSLVMIRRARTSCLKCRLRSMANGVPISSATQLTTRTRMGHGIAPLTSTTRSRRTMHLSAPSGVDMLIIVTTMSQERFFKTSTWAIAAPMPDQTCRRTSTGSTTRPLESVTSMLPKIITCATVTTLAL